MIAIEANELKVIAIVASKNTSVPLFNIYMEHGHKGAKARENVKTRQICMYLAYKMYGHLFSQKLIGMHYGNRDHSTVIHAIQETENHMRLSNKFKILVEKIEKEIEAYNLEQDPAKKIQDENLSVLESVKNQL